MARILGLAILLTLSSGAAPDTIDASGGCPRVSAVTPPDHISVFRSHKRGSRTPAHVERWSFRRYVAAVMASGAWPGHPKQSGRVGAIAIKQYAWYAATHGCRSFHGRHYAITDGQQYLEHWRTPSSRVPVATMRSVRYTWHVRLTKHGRLFQTGWRAGSGRDGWLLFQDSISARARRGWSWRQLVHWALDPVAVHA